MAIDWYTRTRARHFASSLTSGFPTAAAALVPGVDLSPLADAGALWSRPAGRLAWGSVRSSSQADRGKTRSSRASTGVSGMIS